LRIILRSAIRSLCKERRFVIFVDEVDEEEVPDYRDVCVGFSPLQLRPPPRRAARYARTQRRCTMNTRARRSLSAPPPPPFARAPDSIATPMCLAHMMEKTDDGLYLSLDAFLADIDLIANNAKVSRASLYSSFLFCVRCSSLLISFLSFHSPPNMT
jgi:hypothetical protein